MTLPLVCGINTQTVCVVVQCVTMVVHMMHHVTTRLCLQRLTPDDQSALQSPTKGYKVEWVSALMAMCVVHTSELQVLAHSRSATHAIRLDARLYNGTTQQWYNPLLKRERGVFWRRSSRSGAWCHKLLEKSGELSQYDRWTAWGRGLK